MSFLSPVLCLANKHRPLRRRIERSGDTYVSQCRHCGVDVERVGHNNWKRGQSLGG